MHVSRPIPACALVVLLAACGGGDGSLFDMDRSLSSETAQGYAADAQAMPLSAGSTVQLATLTVEAAMRSGGLTPAAGTAPQAALTARCNNGGSLSFSIVGGTASQRLNGIFDAGETYSVNFDNCGHLDDEGVLDGSLSLAVTAYSATQADLTHSASTLRLTSSQGRYTLNGTVREQRSTGATAGGGQRLTSRLTSSGLALQSLVAGRTSSYELRALDWTVVCLLDNTGLLVQRTHQGTLTLVASTPRRPQASLAVATQGTLVASENGLYAAQGSFSLATDRDRIFVSYGATDVTLELDLGNNGNVDRRWSLPRLSFDGEAG